MLDRYHSERTCTDYENQSATVGFFSLEVARYLIDHAKGKKTLWHPGYILIGSSRTVAMQAYHLQCDSASEMQTLTLSCEIVRQEAHLFGVLGNNGSF